MSSFPIALEPTTELLGRFHRTLMDRRQEIPWEQFELERYDPELVEFSRHQWAGRAVAEYHSTAQFAQLITRLTHLGAPVELIGAATRLITDECRHAELCARMADLLGGRGDHHVPQRGLSLLEEEADPWLQIALSVLEVCCFGETLSIPMLESIEMVATDETPRAIARIIAADEEYHSRYGWEVMAWLMPRLKPKQRARIQDRLPMTFAHFERVIGSSPKMLEALAGQDVEISPSTPESAPNLGTLSILQYAAIFYHTVQEQLLPQLEALGFDATGAWVNRPLLADG